jgi:hypothetical protein
MKKILLATLLGVTAFSASAANIGVGISVNVGDPNYYGSIDVGNYPPPEVVNASPMVVQPSVGVALAPLYVHVPLAYSSNWRHYCGMYNACGRPVYFVRDSWYRQIYAPRYRDAHVGRHEEVRHDEHRDHEHREGEGR